MARHELKVVGMHCASCAMLIDEELEDLDGVIEASSSYTRQRTEVQFDEQRTSLASIVGTIEQLGYQASAT